MLLPRKNFVAISCLAFLIPEFKCHDDRFDFGLDDSSGNSLNFARNKYYSKKIADATSYDPINNPITCKVSRNIPLEDRPEKCKSLNCSWDSSRNLCLFPEDYVSYELNDSSFADVDQEWMDVPVQKTFTMAYKLADNYQPLFSEKIRDLQLVIIRLSPTAYQIRYEDMDNDRFEVPIPMKSPEDSDFENNPQFSIKISQHAQVKIERTSTGETIFDNSIGPIIYEDQFLQTSVLHDTQQTKYGLGEKFNDQQMTLPENKDLGYWARDDPVREGINEYGTHPFYSAINKNDGKAHGLFFKNVNAMEISIKRDSSQSLGSITYRTIGGILEFYGMVEETPEKVIQSYTEMIGRPVLQPYWALGFQLCRYGYTGLEDVATQFQENVNVNLPFDVQYVDIDYMERQLDFTIGKEFQGIGEWVEKTLYEENKKKMIIILDPALAVNETVGTYPAYEEGEQLGVFLENSYGKVWPYYENWEELIKPYNNCTGTADDWNCMVDIASSYVKFPDFWRDNTKEWWKNQIVKFYNQLNFSGLWIDMNEPASFTNGVPEIGCENNKWNHPPYVPESLASDLLYQKTICMDVKHTNVMLPSQSGTGRTEKHYDMHSLYGWSEIKPTMDACVAAIGGKRCSVIGRSTYPGAGAQGAGHWLGDNRSAWNHLRQAVIGVQEFSLFGMSYTGTDICGFQAQSWKELCIRWTQIGAFHPFSRNHNAINEPRQDPAAWDQEAIDAMNKVLLYRYQYLPTLYTAMFEATYYGTTAVRPMSHVFPTDSNTHDKAFQFFWSDVMMITPATYENQKYISVYFPAQTVFYDAQTYDRVLASGNINIPTKLDEFHVFYKGGSVISRHDSAIFENTQRSISTETLREESKYLELLVVLDQNGEAKGNLYLDGWDDNLDLARTDADFAYYDIEMNKVDAATSNLKFNRKMGARDFETQNNEPHLIKKIQILGVDKIPENVLLTINDATNEQLVLNFNYNAVHKYLEIEFPQQQLIDNCVVTINFLDETNKGKITYDSDQDTLNIFLDDNLRASGEIATYRDSVTSVEQHNAHQITYSVIGEPQVLNIEKIVIHVDFVGNQDYKTKYLQNVTGIFINGVSHPGTRYHVTQSSIEIQQPFIDGRTSFDIYVDFDEDTKRVDCLSYRPDPNVNDRDECARRGCWFAEPIFGSDPETNNIPWCYFPFQSKNQAEKDSYKWFSNYQITRTGKWDDNTFLLTLNEDTHDGFAPVSKPYGDPWKTAKLTISLFDRSLRMKIYKTDPQTGDVIDRYEVPSQAVDLDFSEQMNDDKKKYGYGIDDYG